MTLMLLAALWAACGTPTVSDGTSASDSIQNRVWHAVSINGADLPFGVEPDLTAFGLPATMLAGFWITSIDSIKATTSSDKLAVETAWKVSDSTANGFLSSDLPIEDMGDGKLVISNNIGLDCAGKTVSGAILASGRTIGRNKPNLIYTLRLVEAHFDKDTLIFTTRLQYGKDVLFCEILGKYKEEWTVVLEPDASGK